MGRRNQDRDPDPERQDPMAAYHRGLRLLGRRAHGVTELRRKLLASHAPDDVETALERLLADGYLDDRAFAEALAAEQIRRRGRGRTRVLADLVRRGVDPSLAEQAWDRALESTGTEPATLLQQALERQLRGRNRLDLGAASRVYNALLRAGFGGAEIRRALDPYLARVESDSAFDRGIPDELP